MGRYHRGAQGNIQQLSFKLQTFNLKTLKSVSCTRGGGVVGRSRGSEKPEALLSIEPAPLG